MASAIGFVGQSIVTDLPHIQGEVNLNLIGDCLILPIADSCSWYWSQSCSSHISSHRSVWGSVFVCVLLCLCQSVWWKMWSLEESPHWEKMSPLKRFSVITQIYRRLDRTLKLCSTGPSGLLPNLVIPGIKRSQWRVERRSHSTLWHCLATFPVTPHHHLPLLLLSAPVPPPPCLTGPSVTLL